MPGTCTLALDAMGGDHGPAVVIPGAALSLERHPQIQFIFFGEAAYIEAELDKHPALKQQSSVVHTSTAISMDDKPSQALRRGKGSSMWLALEAVQKGQAQAAVSAGNTGALMAIARLVLRPMADIERPAIAAIWPTVKRSCIVLDVGANIGASARQLADYALMGAAMARALFRVERPSVALLNVGVEEIKGVEEVRQAHAWLKEMGAELPIDYRGFMEGHQIGEGNVDVVVVEGFAGNIALKTAEGTARQVGAYLKSAMMQSWLSRAGALLARGGFNVLRQKMDPRHSNGAPFLGLNGIAIKSHGGTDAIGFASAIDVGYQMAESGLVARLASDLDTFHGRLAAPGPQVSSG
ncbi:MAG TPA: phosphate acyltransferase PlsX [Hyphomicrobiaceae bacterium]